MSEQTPEEASSFNEFFGEFSEVPLRVHGNDGDVVVSSRIRIVRNIADYPFPNACSDDQRRSTATSIELCVDKISQVRNDQDLVVFPSEQLEELERQFLIEFQSVIDANTNVQQSPSVTDAPKDGPEVAASDEGLEEERSSDPRSESKEFPFSELDDASISDHTKSDGQSIDQDETIFDLDAEPEDGFLTVSMSKASEESDVSFGESIADKWNLDAEIPESGYRDRLFKAVENIESAALAVAEANTQQGSTVPNEFIKTAIVTNEEDHVRLQGMAAGLDLTRVWHHVDRIDDLMEEHLSYAFSPQWGYLTACPANVGTGLRASVVLHLPALATLGRLDQVFRWLIRAGIAGRGLYGENAWGDFYRIANQPTLGKTESQLVTLLQSAVPTIVAYERDARKVMLRHYRDSIEQQVENAFRAIKLPVQRSDEELLSLVSTIRLGLALGLLDQPQIDHIRETFELKRLKQQLEFAVMLEQYNTATKCRDRIRQLEERRHGH